MPTKIQRKSLWHMIHAGGEAFLFTGKKSTSWRFTGDAHNVGDAIIHGSVNLMWGLKSNGWIEQLAPSHYRITEAGRKAAGKREPEMKVLSHGAHGTRWG